MDNNYRKIVPEDVFVSILDREATEEELWMGLPRNFKETVVKRSLLMRMEVDSLSLVRLSLVRFSLVLGHELVFWAEIILFLRSEYT